MKKVCSELNFKNRLSPKAAEVLWGHAKLDYFKRIIYEFEFSK
jgi:hypothetical protein